MVYLIHRRRDSDRIPINRRRLQVVLCRAFFVRTSVSKRRAFRHFSLYPSENATQENTQIEKERNI